MWTLCKNATWPVLITSAVALVYSETNWNSSKNRDTSQQARRKGLDKSCREPERAGEKSYNKNLAGARMTNGRERKSSSARMINSIIIHFGSPSQRRSLILSGRMLGLLGFCLLSECELRQSDLSKIYTCGCLSPTSVFYKKSCFSFRNSCYSTQTFSSSCNIILTSEYFLWIVTIKFRSITSINMKMHFSMKIVLPLCLLYSVCSQALPLAQGGAIPVLCVLDRSCNIPVPLLAKRVCYSVSINNFGLSLLNLLIWWI